MGDINWKDKCWVTTVFLVRNDEKVLLLWNKTLQAWIPVGGHIDPGETPDEAVKREVSEETGFDFEFLPLPHMETNSTVKVVKPFRFQIEDMPHHNKHMNFVFIGKCINFSEEKQETDEQEKLRWFSESELNDNNNIFLENVRNTSLDAIKMFRENK